MSEHDRTDPHPAADTGNEAGNEAADTGDTETPDYPALSDRQLTVHIRAGGPTARPATRELRHRHLSAVISYARLCARTQAGGNRLVSQAFTLASREVLRGVDPPGPWRHHLLTLVLRVAATWAADGRGAELDTGLAAWLDTESAVHPDRAPGAKTGSTMLAAFHSLPAHQRDVLWYSLVEQEPDTVTAVIAGIDPDTVADLREKAQQGLYQAYIRTHAERVADSDCRGFLRILETAARPRDPRYSKDLEEHLSGCPRCTLALAELTRMADSLRTAVAEGLLGWGGAAYLSKTSERAPAVDIPAPAAPPPPAAAATPDEPPPGDAGSSRRPLTARWPVLLLAATAVTTTIVTALLTTAPGNPSPAGSGAQRPAPPSASSTPAGSAPPIGPSASAAPSRKPTMPPRYREGGYALLVNMASGQCLDIAFGALQRRTDVITAPCTGARTQYWRLDDRGLLHSYADPGFCLNSRGSTNRGVGIRPCSSADSRKGKNLVFTLDNEGMLRPYIAPDHAVTPDTARPGSTISLRPAQGRADQRWTFQQEILEAGGPPADRKGKDQRPALLAARLRARRLRTARRSSSLRPPHTPACSAEESAQSRQGSTTGQRRQTALARSSCNSPGPEPLMGKNSSGSSCRQAAWWRQSMTGFPPGTDGDEAVLPDTRARTDRITRSA